MIDGNINVKMSDIIDKTRRLVDNLNEKRHQEKLEEIKKKYEEEIARLNKLRDKTPSTIRGQSGTSDVEREDNGALSQDQTRNRGEE